MPAAATGGVNFWTGNHPLATGEGDLAANPAIKQADLEFRAAHPGLTAEALEPIYYRESLRYIVDHPGWWVSLLARKSFYVAVPVGASYALHSSRYRLAAVASYLLLLPFTLAGLWQMPRDARPTALFLLAGSAVLVCLVFFPQERYRTPVIDPALIVCAAGAVARLIREHATERSRRCSHLQRARQPAGAGSGGPGARWIPPARRRRRVAGRDGSDCGRSGARVSRAASM